MGLMKLKKLSTTVRRYTLNRPPTEMCKLDINTVCCLLNIFFIRCLSVDSCIESLVQLLVLDDKRLVLSYERTISDQNKKTVSLNSVSISGNNTISASWSAMLEFRLDLTKVPREMSCSGENCSTVLLWNVFWITNFTRVSLYSFCVCLLFM